jgi:hypothetical protein
LDEARQETGEALKLEPASKAALAAQRSIEAKEAAKN